MILACLDLEGVLVPEIWLDVAEQTGIEALKRTTRDEPDYDVLMKQRLEILSKHGLGLTAIQEVIAAMSPLPGAAEFLQLGYPTLFCHNLEVDDSGMIVDYHLRLPDPKRRGVRAFHDLNLKVIAAGDSYNDTNMLLEADAGILFRPPENVIREFPQLPVARDYDELRKAFQNAEENIQ